jgi:hypothetical protein
VTADDAAIEALASTTVTADAETLLAAVIVAAALCTLDAVAARVDAAVNELEAGTTR